MSGGVRHELAARWRNLMHALQIPDASAQPEFEFLTAAYAEPTRFYHNLDHLAQVLRTIEEWQHEARSGSLVQLAAWYHDAVYDSTRADNETRSADWLNATCAAWGLPGEIRDQARRLVLATKTHECSAEDADAQLLLDADLAILGADEVMYANYAGGIRQEYAWVAEDVYRRGRADVLNRFLQCERIYFLSGFHDRLEARAKRNLRGEMALLLPGN